MLPAAFQVPARYASQMERALARQLRYCLSVDTGPDADWLFDADASGNCTITFEAMGEQGGVEGRPTGSEPHSRDLSDHGLDTPRSPSPYPSEAHA